MYEALCVGINDYPWKPLRYAVADAKFVASSLSQSSPAYSVATLYDREAGRGPVLGAIEAISRSASNVKLIYLAGHGMVRDTGAYFVCHNALDPSEMISFAEIRERISPALTKKSGTVCLVLDCCNSGGLDVSHPYSLENFRSAVSREIVRTNVVLMLACTLGSSSRERGDLGHGVFTYHFCEGMLGSAAGADGSVSAETLFAYVAKMMEAEGDQRPVLRTDITGRAVLVPTAPRLPKELERRRRAGTSVADLRSLLEQSEEKVALLKPPFTSRQQYRESGWLQASKVVVSVAERRQNVVREFHDVLEGDKEWQHLSADADALISEFATGLSIGTNTDMGCVEDKIGEGGFGTVYKVKGAGGLYALKVLHPSETGNRAKMTRFRNGYRAMDRLVHPRVVKVHKFAECPFSFFMDFVDGVNLRKWLHAALEPVARVSLILDVVSTVEYAHASGVVHRDIKPENVIMRYSEGGASFEPVLTDFDLAWFAGVTKTTRTSDGFGAPFYSAPEQILTPALDVAHEPTVDVYSLAMLSLFVLTGEDPVQIDPAFERLAACLAGWPVEAARKEMEAVLRSAAATSVEKRLKTVAQLRRSLMNIKYQLYRGSDPDAACEIIDFWHVFAASMNRDVFHEGGGNVRLLSQSGRTSVAFQASVEGGVFRSVMSVRKLGGWLAVGAATAVAKEALVRRLDAATHQWRTDNPTAAARRRGRNVRAGDGEVYLDVTLAIASARSAKVLASLVADLIAVYEAF